MKLTTGTAFLLGWALTASLAAQCKLQSPSPPAVLGPSATFVISCPSNVQEFNLRLGTAAYISSQPFNIVNLYVPKPAASNTETVPSIPQKGAIVYATLLSEAGGKWLSKPPQYTFTEGSGYALEWSYAVAACTSSDLSCVASFTLTGPAGLDVVLGPGVRSYALGNLAAGSYTYSIYPSGYNQAGAPITGPSVSATLSVP